MIAYTLQCNNENCKNNPFYAIKVGELDATANLQILDWNVIKNDQAVYIDCKRLIQAHAPTFSLLPNGYTRDQFHIFYNDKLLLLNPENITLLQYSLIKDETNVYLYDRKLLGAHGSSFKLIKWPIAKDDFTVFDLQQWKKIEEAKPDSFVHVYGLFFKDALHAFLEGTILEDSHAPTFMPLQHYYSMDAFHVYFYERQIQFADPSSFTVLSKLWAKDAKNVYLQGELFKNAEASTFTVLLFGYAKDLQHVFYFDQIIEDALVYSFDILPCKMIFETQQQEEGCASDGTHFYFKGQKL